MITPGILIVTGALQQALATFRANLSALVPDIFAALPSQQQTEIQTWFGNTANQLLILSGYLEQPQQVPCIAVTAFDMQEKDDYTGLAESMAKQGDGSYNLSQAVTFSTSFSCLCLAFNYNFALYLSMFARWALLWERQAITASGLYNQRISAQEIEPAVVYLHRGGQKEAVFVYQYLVTLKAEHVDTITTNIPAITSVAGTVTAS